MIDSSDSPFRRDDYKELQSSALSNLMVKKENIKSHSGDLEHFIGPGGWLSWFTL